MYSRTVNYGLPPEMGMVGLRDVFVVAPASSFHDSAINISSDPQSLGLGVIPVLTAAPCLDQGDDMNNRSRGGGIQLWQQNHHHHQQQQAHFLKTKSGGFDCGNLVPGGGTGAPANSASTCLDCGNQAKKGCSHRRCRTCCKSRGYDCSTHVKSTWVPASRRRERQQVMAPGATSGSKKARLVSSQTTTTSHTSTSNTTPPRSFDTGTSQQKDGTLPGQVRAPAVFKCVRVTGMDDGEDQIAYQAVVKIGGHVFKGFLYDQGIESRSDHDVFPNISELYLGGASPYGVKFPQELQEMVQEPPTFFGETSCRTFCVPP